MGAEDLIETLYGHGYRINPSFLQDSSSRSPLSAEPGKELEDAIAQIWQNIREGVFNHLKTLEQAVTSLQSQILDQNQLQTAQKSAHQLAGTVATFGFEAASYIAKAIEILLQNQALHLKTTHSLTQLVKTLRLELEQQPINCVHEENTFTQLNSSQDLLLDTKPIRIMAVDDDATILILVKQILENEGIQVTTLEKPTKIWETLENVQPNLLILDINMPEMNGLELCQLIRETAQWSWLPILILTVQTDRQTVQQVFACGADDYLAKPIVPEELSTQVCNRIRRSQRLKQ